MWYLQCHFVCDKLCAFCAIFFSFRFTIGFNTFIVSRLEFFCIIFDAHPHSGWFICLAPGGARRTNSHIIRKPLSWAVFIYFILELAIISKNKSVFFDNSIEWSVHPTRLSSNDSIANKSRFLASSWVIKSFGVTILLFFLSQ